MSSRLLRNLWIVGSLLVLIVATATPQTVTSLRDEGESALRDGNYFRAVELFRRALELNSRDLGSNHGLAEAYYWLGEYDQAETYAAQARRLDRRNPGVITLSGRIAIGLGDLDAAEQFFQSALALEPNNADAELGLAELALAAGKSLDAVRALERALRIRPEYRKALLSLVLVYEESGEIDVAERYLELALEAHGGTPETHILAAEFYLRRGNIAEAARHARVAQSLDADNTSAPRIRTIAAILNGDYDEVVVTTEELLRLRRDDAVIWYLRGIALLRLGRTDDGMTAFRSALRFNPDNEIVRLVAEETALSEYPMDAAVRTELAAFVADKAARLASEFQYRKALAFYQRALRLTPFDSQLRRDYAELHRTMGNSATYLSELKVIADSGAASSDVQARIAVFENALSNSVGSRWGIDQFTLRRNRTAIGIYLVSGAEPTEYPLSGEPLLAALSRTVESLPRVTVAGTAVVADYAEAFARARSEDVTFFVLLRFENGPRTFGLRGSLYVARTGSPVATLSAVRSGPDRISDVLIAVSRRVEDLFPLRAAVIGRRGMRVVVDAGSRDGLPEGAELQIVPASTLLVEPEALGYGYDASEVLGSITITTLDDLIAEGVLRVRGLTDAVVVGDVAVLPGEQISERTVETLYPVLYDRVRALR